MPKIQNSKRPSESAVLKVESLEPLSERDPKMIERPVAAIEEPRGRVFPEDRRFDRRFDRCRSAQAKACPVPPLETIWNIFPKLDVFYPLGAPCIANAKGMVSVIGSRLYG